MLSLNKKPKFNDVCTQFKNSNSYILCILRDPDFKMFPGGNAAGPPKKLAPLVQVFSTPKLLPPTVYLIPY